MVVSGKKRLYDWKLGEQTNRRRVRGAPPASCGGYANHYVAELGENEI